MSIRIAFDKISYYLSPENVRLFGEIKSKLDLKLGITWTINFWNKKKTAITLRKIVSVHCSHGKNKLSLGQYFISNSDVHFDKWGKEKWTRRTFLLKEREYPHWQTEVLVVN